MATNPKNTDIPDHISRKPFSEMLAEFVQLEAPIGNPMADDKRPSISIMKTEVSRARGQGSPKRTSSLSGETTWLLDTPDADDLDNGSIRKDIQKIDDDLGYIPDFDLCVEDAFTNGEDIAFRNNLISLGRKYAVKGMEEAGETSEVSKAFSRQEQAVDQLMEEYMSASVAVQRDIEMIRGIRGPKNTTTLSNLLEVQATHMNGRLAVIKEMNAMAKTKFELTMKLKRDSTDEAGDSNASTQAIQRIFSMGRSELVPSDDYETVPTNGYDDGTIESTIQISAPVPDAVTDGDFFIQHENDGIEYVLDIETDDDGEEYRQIYAMDRDGSIVSDYPSPANQESLKFVINEMTGEAVDQLQRKYKVRRNGEEVGKND